MTTIDSWQVTDPVVIGSVGSINAMRIHPYLARDGFDASLIELLPGSQYSINCPKIGLLAEAITIRHAFRPEVMQAVISELENIPEDYEEIFHRDYAEVDSGNIVDSSGMVTGMLDELSTLVSQGAHSNFNKISMRKSDQLDLNDLHVDYFNSAAGDFKRGSDRAIRYIFNLGNSWRYTAVMPVPTNLLFGLPSPNEDRYLLDRVLSRINPPLKVFLIPVPPISPDSGTVSCLRLDVFHLIHSGYGRKGDFAAIITSIE